MFIDFPPDEESSSAVGSSPRYRPLSDQDNGHYNAYLVPEVVRSGEFQYVCAGWYCRALCVLAVPQERVCTTGCGSALCKVANGRPGTAHYLSTDVCWTGERECERRA